MTSDIDTRPPETEHDISTLARLARDLRPPSLDRDHRRGLPRSS